jgi:chemotaxis protein CheX
VPESLSTEDVEDALGELANITGGHLKSLLPGGGTMTIPVTAVIEDVADRPGSPGSEGLCQVAFDCEGQPFLVAVVR